MTVHDKTNHIAAKMIFELRRPLLKSTFELRLEKFEFSSRCSYKDMSQNVPGSPILNFSSKRNETLLRTLHAEAPYIPRLCKYVAPPTKSISSMAAKTLE